MIILISGLLLFATLNAVAIPPLPSSFFGNAKINGGDIPEGTILKADINGEVFALAIVNIFEGQSVYYFDIPGDDPSTVGVVEGGKPGDIIQFMLGDNPANETGLWVSGTNVNTDLTFNEPIPSVLPANFHGTVKVDGENPLAGTMIKGVINGVTYIESKVSLYSGSAVYSIRVPGDDPDTPDITEGGVSGDIVQFIIDNSPAEQAGIWLSESNTEINLTANEANGRNFYYYLPMFNK